MILLSATEMKVNFAIFILRQAGWPNQMANAPEPIDNLVPLIPIVISK
jgi:hypothetical protein